MLWLLIGYMLLFIHRPFEVWPVLAEYRVELLYVIVAGAFWAFAPKRWLPNPLHGCILAFAAAVLLCWGLSPWADFSIPLSGSATLGQRVVEDWFKIVVFYVLLVTTISDERNLKRLALGFLAVTAIYLSHSLFEYGNGRHVYRMGIPRLIGVDTTLGDPNSFGASIVFTLPFLAPFWLTQPSRWLRAFLIGYFALAVACIGLTGSRSALMGLILWVAITIWQSQYRWRLGIAAVLAAPFLFVLLPGDLQSRFETIINPDVGPANARESSQSRLEALPIAYSLWSENPLTGCGPGHWRKATGRKLESHSLYGQVLGETGTLGTVTFAAFLLVMWLNIRKVNAAYRLNPQWGQDFIAHFVRAIGVALLLLLFEGLFGHNLFRFSWLWYGAFLIIARYCVEQRLAVQPFEKEPEAELPDREPDGGTVEWIGKAA